MRGPAHLRPGRSDAHTALGRLAKRTREVPLADERDNSLQGSVEIDHRTRIVPTNQPGRRPRGNAEPGRRQASRKTAQLCENVLANRHPITHAEVVRMSVGVVVVREHRVLRHLAAHVETTERG